MSEVKKMVKDGKVAVLISPEFGAGWSTWAYDGDAEPMIFSPELVTAVLAGAKPDELVALAKHLFPQQYEGGARDLEVRWLPVGTLFRIDEYDGKESLEIAEDVDWRVA